MRRLSLAIVITMALVFFSCNPAEKKIKIGYLQITQDPVLDTAKKGIFQALEDSGFVKDENVKIIENNAQGDLSMVITILQSFQSQGVDLIITSGTPCMAAAAQKITDIPVVFTISFGPEQVGIKQVPSNIYGVYDPLDAESYVSMMQECMPKLKRVGLPYNNAEPNAEYSAKVFQAEFEKRGITVVSASVTSVNDLVMTGQFLKSQNIDAMIVTADNTIYLGLNVLSKVANESKIPLFVTEPLQVEKGAAVGMGVNYEHWGYLGGQKAAMVLSKRTGTRHIEAITDHDLIINQNSCVMQNLKVPESVYQKATKIME